MDNLDNTEWLSVSWTGEQLLIKQRKGIQSRNHVLSDKNKAELESDVGVFEELEENETVSNAVVCPHMV